jgi:hypothetical protein
VVWSNHHAQIHEQIFFEQVFQILKKNQLMLFNSVLKVSKSQKEIEPPLPKKFCPMELKFVHFKKTILVSFKSVVIFAENKTKSEKMTTLLKEMRIAQVFLE